MKIEMCMKESFSVMGKEGFTLDGEGFIQRLWADADFHFEEVHTLVKKEANGNIVGIRGLMSDFSHMFKPREYLSRGISP